jgi:hypothetical protein
LISDIRISDIRFEKEEKMGYWDFESRWIGREDGFPPARE